jgi:hypothetical protein
VNPQTPGIAVEVFVLEPLPNGDRAGSQVH